MIMFLFAQGRMKESLYFELKEGFGIAFEPKRHDQACGEGEGKTEDILKITKAQLEKPPVGKKGP